ncbi:MAG: S8 family serine peptidase [Thermoanaerobaculia bacterium]|nr:S8 family serine peptidase [Thermoanaerobaculia bacterium]
MRRAASLLLLVGIAPGWAPAFAAPPRPWNLQLEKGKRAPTTVTATNRCKATHTFEVTTEPGLTWMTFPAARSVEVAPGAAGTVPVTVNASGLDVGEVEGDVTVHCLDCKADLLCAQDVDLFHVRLKVLWPEEELKRLDPGEYAPAQVMLAFDDGARGSQRPPAEHVHGTVTRSESFELPSIHRRVSLLTLPPGSSVPLAVLQAQKDPAVRLAQPNFVYELAQLAYNDPYAAEQWGPRRMGVEAAHRTSTGKNVKLVVLDSGVDFRHPDLKRRIAEKVSFVQGGTYERDPHGTSMTGAIAAEPNNRIGIYGVAPDAEIFSARVCAPKVPHAPEACVSEGVARGLDFAVVKGASVASLSLAGPYDPLVRQLVDRAVSRGVVVVAAAGNSGPSAPPRYPAALPNVIAVSAIDSNDKVYERANRGPHVKVVAPGVNVFTTLPDGRYGPSTGTSIATAHVSGVVALLLSAHPGLSPKEVEDILTSTASDLGPPGKDDTFGWGAVDACRALAKAAKAPGSCD